MILFRIELVFKGRNFIILNHRRVIIALLTLLLIRGAGNNVPYNPAWAYKEHYSIGQGILLSDQRVYKVFIFSPELQRES